MAQWGEPRFDEYQFANRRARAVSAETGISYQDFGSMRIKRQKPQQERRLPTPEWAMNDVMLRERVLTYLEARLYLNRGKFVGNHDERLKRINEECKRRIPILRQGLQRRLEGYNLEAKAGASEDRLRKLQIEIANRDTDILLHERGLPAVVVAVVYSYYRRGWNSAEIANNFGIKAPMIRIWLYRLNTFDTDRASCRRTLSDGSRKRFVWSPDRLKALFLLKAKGLSDGAAGKILGAAPNTVRKQWLTVFGNLKVGVDVKRRAEVQRAEIRQNKMGRPRMGRPRGIKEHCLRNKKTWTEENIALLAELYNRGASYQEIRKHFPDRTRSSLNYAVMRFVTKTRKG